MNLDGFNYERRDKAGLQAADAFLEQIGSWAEEGGVMVSSLGFRVVLFLERQPPDPLWGGNKFERCL